VSEQRHGRGGTVALAAAAVAGGLAALALAEGSPPPEPQQPPPDPAIVFGQSVQGRPLQAVRVGDPQAKRRVLIVGCIHGNECAGKAVTRRLAGLRVAPGTAVWLVHDANPDGYAMGRRQNARGVDLNRNFSYRWRPLDRPGGTYWSGPRPLSEPESRALRGLILRLRPSVTIWYHQHMRLVDLSGGDPAVVRRYARIVGLPVHQLIRYPGSATTWQNRYFPDATAFVVELPAGRMTPTAVAHHTAAVLAAARPPARRTGTAPRPAIVQHPIPFGPGRQAETARYALRHYGRATWRLVDPRVIVQHYTVTRSFSAVYNTFAPDRRDPELHELPGTCAHFVVDRDGTTYQLVDRGTICRHAVGLNHTAIGIEHVGSSDGEVMGNARQLSASLRLTRWLRCVHGIPVRDVIGHAETLSSPYHLELVPRLRDQTHSDFARAAMTRYRARLARLPCGPAR
jgi:N-acetylmuramoyl-L-alanine amidase